MNCKFELTYRKGNDVHTYREGTDDLTLTVSDSGERRTVTVRANVPIELCDYRETAHDFFTRSDRADPDPKGDLYFINGYQSWTETREFYGDARERDVRRLPKPLVRSFALDRYGDAPQPVLALLDVALLRAAAAREGVSDIAQKGDEIRFTLGEFHPEAVVALCGLGKYRRRVTLAAGETPSLTFKLPKGADALEAARELIDDLRLAGAK